MGLIILLVGTTVRGSTWRSYRRPGQFCVWRCCPGRPRTNIGRRCPKQCRKVCGKRLAEGVAVLIAVIFRATLGLPPPSVVTTGLAKRLAAASSNATITMTPRDCRMKCVCPKARDARLRIAVLIKQVWLLFTAHWNFGLPMGWTWVCNGYFLSKSPDTGPGLLQSPRGSAPSQTVFGFMRDFITAVWIGENRPRRMKPVGNRCF